MKSKILEIVKELGPKHFSHRIKNTPKLWQWVLDQTNHITEDISISERIYLAVSDESPICLQGKNKKFKSFSEGYGFCAKTGQCECAQQQVSQKVSEAKQNYTEERKRGINQKREQTTLQLHGVTNNAQTERARQKHDKFYDNPENIRKTLEKQQNTFHERYGPEVDNAQDLPWVREKTEKTNLAKYGVKNPMQNPNIARKSSDTRKENFDPERLLRNNYFKIKKKLKELFRLELLITEDEYKGVADRPLWSFKCLDCGNIFEKRYDHGSLPICRACYPTILTYKSSEELEILEYIKSLYDGPIISGDKNIINPFEVDILIPEKRIGIEYCGLFWHSEISSGKGYLYHKKKMDLLEEKGIDLITIFSDEFLNNKNLVFNMIGAKLNFVSEKIFARNTIVKKISKHESYEFLNLYHIQNPSKSSYINYGLFYDNEIVAVMSFRNKGSGKYELTRFASKTQVLGGASKLFKEFQRDYNPSEVKTFADKRWSRGNLYYEMDFELSGEVPPMQYYVEGYEIRYPKLYFKKSKLIRSGMDSNKTEWEILQELGYDRIWDCGKLRFVWKKS